VWGGGREERGKEILIGRATSALARLSAVDVEQGGRRGLELSP